MVAASSFLHLFKALWVNVSVTVHLKRMFEIYTEHVKNLVTSFMAPVIWQHRKKKVHIKKAELVRK